MNDFYDGKYLTASEKTKIVKQLDKFLKSNCKEENFTKAVYKHLSLHFGFIAHYNQQGFYHARFEDGLSSTIESVLNCSPWTFNDDNTSGNADLNKAIQDTFRKYSTKLMDKAISDEISLLEDSQLMIDNRLKQLKG